MTSPYPISTTRGAPRSRRPAPRELAGLALLALGVVLFDGGLAWLGENRGLPLGIASTGSWWLARRLGAEKSGAALAAVGFAGAWAAAGGVRWDDPVAWIPFGLLALEACGRAPGAARLALVVVSQLLLFGLAEPQQRGALALASAAFALGGPGAGRVGRLLGVVVGAACGIGLSPHGVGGDGSAGAGLELDLLGAGLALCCVGALDLAAEGGRSRRVLGMVFGLAALVAAGRLGFELDVALGVRPARGAAPVLPVVLGFALAGTLAGGRGGLRGADSGLVLWGVAAWALATGFPGLGELWARIPLLGATERAAFGPPAALLLGLVAARGLSNAPRGARHAAGLSMAALLALAWLWPSPAPVPALAFDLPDDLVQWEIRPEPARAGALFIEGGVDEGLPVEQLRVMLVTFGSDEVEPLELPVVLDEATPDGAGVRLRPFRVRHDERSASLPAGQWLIALSLEGRSKDGERASLAIRRIGVHSVPEAGLLRACLAALSALLLFLPGARSRAVGAIAAALAQAAFAF